MRRGHGRPCRPKPRKNEKPMYRLVISVAFCGYAILWGPAAMGNIELGSTSDDERVSIIYNVMTGEIALDSAGMNLNVI